MAERYSINTAQIAHVSTMVIWTPSAICFVKALSAFAVQPIVIMSNISSLISVLGFGASTTYLSALLTRMSGGLCNFTFGYADGLLCHCWWLLHCLLVSLLLVALLPTCWLCILVIMRLNWHIS